MNRIDKLFKDKSREVLSIYFTAGFPNVDDTTAIIEHLQEAGADMIEIGIPFSDPVADGPTIQESNKKALDNGMTIERLFTQLKDIRKSTHIPLILMGYINPVLQYGFEAFCKKCEEIGIDGLILPDLPIEVFVKEYKKTCDEFGLRNIFLITPQTSEVRIRLIDEASDGFIYMVSSASTTGAKDTFGDIQQAYFKRINEMGLNQPTLVGFGISNHQTFKAASEFSSGAIIGSAFIKAITASEDLKKDIHNFIQSIRKHDYTVR